MSATLEEIQYHAQRRPGEVVHAVEFLKGRGWRTLCGKWTRGFELVDRAPMYADEIHQAGPPVTCANCLREVRNGPEEGAGE